MPQAGNPEPQRSYSNVDQPAEMPGEWASFFALLDTLEIPQDFMDDRNEWLPQDREGR